MEKCNNGKFINFLIERMHINTHKYMTHNLNLPLHKFEMGFQEVTGHNGTDISKEIVDDIVFMTHRGEDKIHLAATTLSESDVYIQIDLNTESPKDLAVVPGNGISVILADIIKNKDGEIVPDDDANSYLAYKIMRRFDETTTMSELVLFEGRKFMAMNPQIFDTPVEESEEESKDASPVILKVADVLLAENDNFLISLTNGDIYTCAQDYKIIANVKDVILPLIELDEEKEVAEWGIYSPDLISVRIAKKENDISNMVS